MFHTPRCAARRSTANDLIPGALAPINIKNRFLNRSLTRTGTARNDGNRGLERCQDCIPLFRIQTDTQFFLFRIQRSLNVIAYKLHTLLCFAVKHLCQLFLSLCCCGTVYTVLITDQPAGINQSGRTVCRHIFCQFRCFENLQCFFDETVLFHAQISFSFCFLKCVKKSLIHTLWSEFLKSHTHCDLIGGMKPNARNLTEFIGMIFHDIHRFVAIKLIKLDGSVRCDTVGHQKGNHITSASIGEIGLTDLFQFILADTGNREQPLGFIVKHLKGLYTKLLEYSLSYLGSNAFNLAGGEVGNNPFFRW